MFVYASSRNGKFVLQLKANQIVFHIFYNSQIKIDKRYRTEAVLSTSFGWVVGYLLLPMVAYVVRDFRYLQLIPTLIMVAMFALWVPQIPESPRWLLTKKRYKEAYDLLLKACRFNRKVNKDFKQKFDLLYAVKKVETIENTNDETYSMKNSTVCELLKNRQYRSITLILWVSFYINGFIYHGFNLNVDILGGDVYLNFALAGLIEIPSTVLNLVGMRFTGRKRFTILTILSAAMCYSVIVFLQSLYDANHWLIVFFCMLGKMFIFSTYNAIYIHAGEIFPTQLRHSGVSSCSIASRFGSMVAPFVKELVSLNQHKPKTF